MGWNADEHAWLLPLEIALITLIYSSFKSLFKQQLSLTLHSSHSSYVVMPLQDKESPKHAQSAL